MSNEINVALIMDWDALTLNDKAHIIGCLKGCIGIEAPETTVPELVAACKDIATGPIDEPQIDLTGEYHTGLHCGLEDRDIVDRYDACDHGFEKGVERALEWAQGVVEAVLAHTGQKPTNTGDDDA